MSCWNLLLRVMLSLGLILNGSGSASAAAMLHVPDPAFAASDMPQTESTAPCLEHSAATPEPDKERTASSAAHDEGQSEHGKPGCCGSTGCIASCLQHAPATIVAPWLGTAVPVHSASVGWADAAHASPVLPDRIRPPIA